MDLTPIVAATLARNRGPAPGDPAARVRPDYGISARLRGATIELDLTFRAAAAYCCYEPGCHLPWRDGRRWDDLRAELAAAGVGVPPRLEMVVSVLVEDGALFFDYAGPDPTRRGVYALAPVGPYRGRVNWREG